MNQPEVVMIGLGYIGLPTAALIASNKVQVHGVDVNPKVVNTINRGEIHIVEPALDTAVASAVKDGYLKAALKPVVANTYLIVVPTPFKAKNEPDISFVESATKEIIPLLKEGDLYILESTSPVGTTEKMMNLIYSERPELKDTLFIAYCPERVLPGNVMYELVENDRVIGGVDAASTDKAVSFYSQYIKGALHKTNARTAEMCKLVENSSRDVQIAFANELSLICDKAEINVWELIELANKHPRVNILQPGCGVGGHCISVDPWFIVDSANGKAKMVEQARRTNDYKAEWVISKIKNNAISFEKKHGRKPMIACMGLAFKADIDDLRQSPALYIALELNKELNIIAVEPNISELSGLILTSLEIGLESDICVYLVAHSAFEGLEIKSDDLSFIDWY